MDGYQLAVPETLQAFVSGDASDPAWTALREHALVNKWDQGRFDDTIGVLQAFADKGLLEPVFNAEAETAALGEGGRARQEELTVFLSSLKDRNDIDEAMFGELSSLIPTAAGTRALEFMKKLSQPSGGPPPVPTVLPDGAQPGDTPAQAEARAMARDPKYGKDKPFTKDADARWISAFGG